MNGQHTNFSNLMTQDLIFYKRCSYWDMIRVDDPFRLRKKDLEITLEGLLDLKSPNLKLEQYPVSPPVAAEMIWVAHFHNDIFQRKILELGCGTGKLSIACALLEAFHVTGIDIDSIPIKLARENSMNLGLQNRVSWICGDIEVIQADLSFDVVVMNPPFGVRGPDRDIRFLNHAMKLAPIIYSLHLGREKNRSYISEFVVKKGFTIDFISNMTMSIPHLFSFHQKRRHSISVDFFRIIRLPKA